MAKLENKTKLFTLPKFRSLDPKQDYGFFEVFEPGHGVCTYLACFGFFEVFILAMEHLFYASRAWR